MAKTTGKSLPQTALRKKIQELYDDAFVEEEVYIGDLIKERGYTMNEIARELGHKPHRMFVDIMMRDLDRIVAFEYHGEQHYSLVGNMTKTTADLLLNKQLDEEKSWILGRLGIPIVAVPFDMYIDERVIEELISTAYDEMQQGLAGMSECLECHRLFPGSEMVHGVCGTCLDKQYAMEEEERESAENEFKQRANEKKRAAQSEYAEKRKAENKRKRDEAREKRKQERREKAERRHEMFDSEYDDYADSGDGYQSDDVYSNDDGEAEWNRSSASDEAYKEARKERAKQARKDAYQRYKESPQYQEKKERERQKRKEAYQRRKEYLKGLQDDSDDD